MCCDVILIAQNGGDVPFEVGHIRHLRYLNNGEDAYAYNKNSRRSRMLTGRD